MDFRRRDTRQNFPVLLGDEFAKPRFLKSFGSPKGIKNYHAVFGPQPQKTYEKSDFQKLMPARRRAPTLQSLVSMHDFNSVTVKRAAEIVSRESAEQTKSHTCNLHPIPSPVLGVCDNPFFEQKLF